MRNHDGRLMAVARAATIATTALATSAVAHALGGGHLTSTPVLAVLGVLLLAAAAPVARRRPTFPVLLAWSGAAQLAVHVTLGWLHPVADTTVSVAAHHGVHTATTAGAAAVPGATLPMLVAHLVGTLAAAWIIVGADRSAELARAWWAGTVAVLMGPAVPASAPPRAAVPARAVRHTGWLLSHTVARRGPPLLAVA